MEKNNMLPSKVIFQFGLKMYENMTEFQDMFHLEEYYCHLSVRYIIP